MQTFTVIDLLEDAVKKHPNRILYEDEKEKITFAQVFESSKKIATKISEVAMPNTPIAVLSEKCVYTPAYYLGILFAGCFYVPLGTDAPAARLNHILETTDVKVLLTDNISEKHLDNLEFKGQKIKVEECDSVNPEKINERRSQITNGNPQHIIFTSGSTGKPKGVVTNHGSVVEYIKTFSDTFGFDKQTVLGSQAPFEYDAAVRDMFLPLCTGCKTVLIPKQLFSDPIKLFEYVKEKKINTLIWAASAFTLSYELDVFSKVSPPRLEKLFFIGSVMQPQILKYLSSHFPNTTIVNHYGPTETTASCTYYITSRNKDYSAGIPIGKPFRNRGVFLVGDDNKQCKSGDVGEIYISGTCVGNGYYNNSWKTAEVFVQNPLHNKYRDIVYKTGDLGKTDCDGNLLFLGRRDRQIKFMGYRIELEEIEFSAAGCLNIKDVACVFDDSKNTIILFYTGTATSKDIAIELRKRLPSFMVPRKFIQIDSMPKLFNGKVDMQKLKNMHN